MGRRVDLVNQSFGEWKVIEYDYSDGKHAYWKCCCSCGTEKTVRSDMLKMGKSKSCGKCKRNVFIIKDNIAFGYTEKGEEFIIDAEDLKNIKDYCWYKDTTGYIATHINGTGIRLHTFILKNSRRCSIDHINRNSLDNRKANLRVCTQQQNTFNQGISKNNTTGFKGVTKKNNKWIAQIMHNRQHIYLGIFNSPQKAAHAYNTKAKELFGEYAFLNILESDCKGGDIYAK